MKLDTAKFVIREKINVRLDFIINDVKCGIRNLPEMIKYFNFFR